MWAPPNRAHCFRDIFPLRFITTSV